MKPRYYVHMYADNFQGVRNHYASELVNRLPLQGRLVRLSKAAQVLNGQKATSVRLGKALIERLKQLGIK